MNMREKEKMEMLQDSIIVLIPYFSSVLLESHSLCSSWQFLISRSNGDVLVLESIPQKIPGEHRIWRASSPSGMLK